MDSMNVLEVLLVLEGKGYDIRLIEVGGIGTVRNLIDILGE
jgi:putative protein kinase ArgK-like GTPase of G3E family